MNFQYIILISVLAMYFLYEIYFIFKSFYNYKASKIIEKKQNNIALLDIKNKPGFSVAFFIGGLLSAGLLWLNYYLGFNFTQNMAFDLTYMIFIGLDVTSLVIYIYLWIISAYHEVNIVFTVFKNLMPIGIVVGGFYKCMDTYWMIFIVFGIAFISSLIPFILSIYIDEDGRFSINGIICSLELTALAVLLFIFYAHIGWWVILIGVILCLPALLLLCFLVFLIIDEIF